MSLYTSLILFVYLLVLDGLKEQNKNKNDYDIKKEKKQKILMIFTKIFHSCFLYFAFYWTLNRKKYDVCSYLGKNSIVSCW